MRVTPKKIFVTGATGLVGRTIVPALRIAGHDVVVAVRPGSVKDCGATLAFDLGRPITDLNLGGFDCVVHLAAIANRRKVGDFNRLNCEATLELATCALNHGVTTFVFASTVLVHGDKSVSPLRSDSPIRPRDEYALSKANAEQGLKLLVQAGLDVRVLRLARVRDVAGVRRKERGLAERVPFVPIPTKENRRAYLEPKELASICLASVDRPVFAASMTTQIVASGHESFRQQLAGQSRRRFVRVPTVVWRSADHILTLFGGPSLAGAYQDLLVQRR